MTIGRWVPVIVWACVILVSTSIPSVPVPPGPPGLDKVGHFVMYAVLGLLAIRATWTGRSSVRSMALTLAGVAAFAAIDEWHQGFLPPRQPEVADWVADVAGATVGIGSMAALFTLRRSARS